MNVCANAVSQIPKSAASVNATTLISYKDALLFLGFDAVDDEMEEEDDDDDQMLDDEEEATSEVSEESENSTGSDLIPFLQFTDEEYREWCRPRRKALVLTLPEKTLRSRKMRHNLTQLWYDMEFTVY